MSYEIKNKRTLLESLAMRQRELTECNTKILDWAMKIVSSKKKIPMPQIRISNCRPCTIVPQGVIDPPIPYTNQDSIIESPSAPYTETKKNENHSTTLKKKLTLIEEVEEYLRMEAAKVMAARNNK